MRPVEAMFLGLLAALAISTSSNSTLALVNRTEAFSKVGDMDMEEFVLLKQGDYGNGSQGELLEVRVKDCPRMPCNVTGGKVLPFQVDFKPAASHAKLRVQLSVISLVSKSDPAILEEEVLEPIVGGRPYTLHVISLQVPKGIPHGYGIPLLEITDELGGGKIIEICAFGTNRIIH